MKKITHTKTQRITVEELSINAAGEYDFQFDFAGGGNNSVFAKDVDEAVKRARLMFPKFAHNIVKSTFRKVTVDERKRIDRANYLATC